MSSLFGDDDDLFGDDLFGDELFGDGHSPEDPGLATLTFPAAPFGGLTLPEVGCQQASYLFNIAIADIVC